MSKTAKTLLVVFGSLAVIAMLIFGGIWYWWSSNSGNILKSGGEAMTAGQKHGQGTDEAGCLAAVILRHKASATKDVSTSMVNNLWLKSCLEAAKPNPAVCQNAPAPSDVMASGKWIGNLCVKTGTADPFCPASLGALTTYCHSAERAEKLKAAK